MHALGYKVQVGELALYGMHYGDEVDITPDVYPDFVLVHLSLANGIEVDSDGERIAVPEGSILISAPQHRIRLRWQQDCQQLILRVPKARLVDAWRTVAAPVPPRRPGAANRSAVAPGLRPSRLLAPALSPAWIAQLNLLLAIAGSSDRDGPPGKDDSLRPWLEQLQQSIATFVARQITDDPTWPERSLSQVASEPDGEPSSRVAGHASRIERLERLEAFLHRKLAAPITIGDMTRVTGLGRSQLHQLCRETMGLSPMHWLRGLRLDAVRRCIADQPARDLTEIALLHGFEHLGRFAEYYRARFGELPSQTRQRAGHGPAR